MREPAAPPLERILSRSDHGPRSIIDMALDRDPLRPDTVPAVAPPTLKGKLTRREHNRPTPVPRPDWAKVLCGTKRMYRTYSGNWRARHARLFPDAEQFPRPAVIYSQRPYTQLHDAALAVITGYRQEPLGEISQADLHTEGFERITQFRRYWRRRYVRWGWRPADLISVVELRPWTPHDDDEQAEWLLQRMFGDWL